MLIARRVLLVSCNSTGILSNLLSVPEAETLRWCTAANALIQRINFLMIPRVNCSGSGVWGDRQKVPEDESQLWALAAKLPLRRRGGSGTECSSSDDEAEAEELPAYQFRMGLGNLLTYSEQSLSLC